jgi:chaperonin GroEL
VTLGPRSRSVLIETKWGQPIVCHDGVTIAKEFSLKDPDENLGAQMLRGAAERTGDSVGDGTTTSTLLAHAILADGIRNIAAGASAIDLKRGLDRSAGAAIDALKAQSRPVQSQREKQQVATEEAKGTETTMDVVEGLQFDRGYLSAYFVTNVTTEQLGRAARIAIDREHTTIIGRRHAPTETNAPERSFCGERSRLRAVRSPRTPASTAVWSSRRCGAAQAASDSMPPQGSTDAY